MSLKSNRGIQQADVHQAADALIAEGLRPTIERVRQKIGRGSPNTVSPLLDTWFATLGARLGLGGSAAGEEGAGVPEPVQQAAALLWEAALTLAHQEAAQALAHSRQALAAEHADLAQRRADFEHQRQASQVRQLACEEALQMARAQLDEKDARLAEAGASLQRREGEIDALHEKLRMGEQERDASLRRSEEQAQHHAQERARLEARASANERRLLHELDREREKAKRSRAALAEQERRAAATHSRLEADNLSLGTRLQEREHALQAAHQSQAVAESRACELAELLEAQKQSHAITLKQLDLLLSSPQKHRVQIPIRRRRL